ncbi:MAG: OmpA family protein [Candidatus Nitrotoga sp.]
MMCYCCVIVDERQEIIEENKKISINPSMVSLKTIKNTLKSAVSAACLSSWVACASSVVFASNTGASNGSTKEVSDLSNGPCACTSATALSALEKPQHIAVLADSDNVLRLLLPNRVIYFPADASNVSKGDLRLIHDHARYLHAHKNRTVRLEGHTDELGSSEMNLSLGQRRADAVKKILLMNGVEESQIMSISYGEEKPIDKAHTKSAWFKNRRTEFDYNAK